MENLYEIMNPFVSTLVELLKDDVLLKVRRSNEYFIPDIHIHIVKDQFDCMNIKIYLHIDYLGIYPYILLDQILNMKSLADINNFISEFNDNIMIKKRRI